MYDSARDRGASNAEGDCARWIKTTPTQKTTLLWVRVFDTNEDADAVLAVDFEHFLCRNWHNFSPFVVKIRLFYFCLNNAFLPNA